MLKDIGDWVQFPLSPPENEETLYLFCNIEKNEAQFLLKA